MRTSRRVPLLAFLFAQSFFTKGFVELVQKLEALFGIASFGERAEAQFDIELSNCHARQFIDEFVDAHALTLSEPLKSPVLIIGHSNCHRSHISPHFSQKIAWPQNPNPRKAQFTTLEVPHILSDDHPGSSGNRQLDNMVVALVWQIWSPEIVYFDPFADTRKSREKPLSLCEREWAGCKKLGPAKHVLIFKKQFQPHDRLALSLQTQTQYFATRSSGARQCRNENVCINNDPICHMRYDSTGAIIRSTVLSQSRKLSGEELEGSGGRVLKESPWSATEAPLGPKSTPQACDSSLLIDSPHLEETCEEVNCFSVVWCS